MFFVMLYRLSSRVFWCALVLFFCVCWSGLGVVLVCYFVVCFIFVCFMFLFACFFLFLVKNHSLP